MRKTALVLLIIAAAALITAAFGDANHQRRKAERLAENQESLLQGIEHYRTADSLSAAGVAQLTLTNEELSQHNKRLEQTCQSLDIKLKRVQAAITTATTTELDITMPLHDTIYIKVNDTTPTRARHFEWSDRWTSIAGLIEGDSTTCHITNRDTITIITHTVPRRWLFFKCGIKSVRTEAVSSNPHTEIEWLEAVKSE